MQDSIAQAPPALTLEGARWKGAASSVCAVLMAIVWLVAGVWKATHPLDFAQLMGQLLVPGWLTIPGTLVLATSEILAGILILAPRYRRWGAILSVGLLVVFMLYAGINYNQLVGKECSCFPWIKRTVGPGFFIGDLAMAALAAIAGLWAQRPFGLKGAGLILAAISVFTGVCYGVTLVQQQGTLAPESILVAGEPNAKPYALRDGSVFVYFFDPECMHCFAAAKQMSGYKWKDARVVVVPTRVPHFAQQFLNDTGLQAPVTSDLDKLRAVYPFQDPPYAVALDGGRLRQAFAIFDEEQPRKGLRELGWIE